MKRFYQLLLSCLVLLLVTITQSFAYCPELPEEQNIKAANFSYSTPLGDLDIKLQFPNLKMLNCVRISEREIKFILPKEKRIKVKYFNQAIHSVALQEDEIHEISYLHNTNTHNSYGFYSKGNKKFTTDGGSPYQQTYCLNNINRNFFGHCYLYEFDTTDANGRLIKKGDIYVGGAYKNFQITLWDESK